MRRWFRTGVFVGLLGVLGAVTNVAVAWGCAMWIPLSSGAQHSTVHIGWDPEAVPYWGAESRRRHGAQRLVWNASWVDFTNAPGINLSAALGDPLDMETVPAWSLMDSSTPPSDEYAREFRMVVEDARGWPCVTMASVFTVESGPALPARARGDIWHGITLDKLTRRSVSVGVARVVEFPWSLKVLPLRPLWFRFAVNTIIYGALLWLALLGPFAWRRYRRRRRGCCPACGYDMRHAEHVVCPECGRRVVKTGTGTRTSSVAPSPGG
jgi:hypothetical protein